MARANKLNKCALEDCFWTPATVTDRSKPSTLHIVYINDIQRITATFETVKHPSGLCYFHLKQAQGLFDCKFPLSKHGQPSEQTTIMKHAFEKALKQKQL